MDDTNLKSEIHALYQARCRAEEIDFISREEHRRKLQNLIDLQNKKIEDDFKFEKDKIEREAKIQLSVVTNEQRIQLLEAENNIINQAKEQTREKLKTFHDSPEYRPILIKLLVQGIKTIGEPEVTIQVCQRDIDLVNSCMDEVRQQIDSNEVQVNVDQENFLPETDIGGAYIINKEQTLRVDNTLNGRLFLAAEGSLPQISHILHSNQ